MSFDSLPHHLVRLPDRRPDRDFVFGRVGGRFVASGGPIVMVKKWHLIRRELVTARARDPDEKETDAHLTGQELHLASSQVGCEDAIDERMRE
jgi:hypothetical protein